MLQHGMDMPHTHKHNTQIRAKLKQVEREIKSVSFSFYECNYTHAGSATSHNIIQHIIYNTTLFNSTEKKNWDKMHATTQFSAPSIPFRSRCHHQRHNQQYVSIQFGIKCVTARKYTRTYSSKQAAAASTQSFAEQRVKRKFRKCIRRKLNVFF